MSEYETKRSCGDCGKMYDNDVLLCPRCGSGYFYYIYLIFIWYYGLRPEYYRCIECGYEKAKIKHLFISGRIREIVDCPKCGHSGYIDSFFDTMLEIQNER